jgi:hypothetical protein
MPNFAVKNRNAHGSPDGSRRTSICRAIPSTLECCYEFRGAATSLAAMNQPLAADRPGLPPARSLLLADTPRVELL